ncbi:sulfite exporter TauE/SafE family protein [Fusobacterium sp.]|uniref:sulfite exporter TauE/SafE family protein n=1 Tax=Fusobacterium sp. TaxID=68766 RepID=UPI0026394354|nr:sulfite exporter TauE/SafE family protein [Fusobacterium sp.]
MLNALWNEFNMQTFLFLSVSCFIASFVDAIAGGGGLISVPAFVASGLPIHVAVGSNKMAASFSTLGSAVKYFTSGKVNFKLLKYPIIAGAIGAAFGARVVSHTSEKVLEPLIFIMLLLVVIYTFINKNMGIKNEFECITLKSTILGSIMSFVMCFYIGFFGPGGGSFLLFGLLKIYKFDFIRASGNAKVLNFIANLAGLATFIYYGKVSFLYSIPVGIVMFIGAQCGAKYAIKKGSKFIRPFFLAVSLITIAKMAVEKFL